MEIRINLVLLAILATAWLGLRASTPERVLSADADRQGLAALEDAFAQHPSHAEYAEQLADRYLEAGYADLAVVALRRANPAVLERPNVAYRLARAYELSGRLLDALATADLALSRCGRVLGSTHAHTPAPDYRCSERTYARLDTHRSALEKMVRWGIVDPRTDPRARRAYQLALRRARVAVGEPGEGRPTH